jgi:hypothetical protein
MPNSPPDRPIRPTLVVLKINLFRVSVVTMLAILTKTEGGSYFQMLSGREALKLLTPGLRLKLFPKGLRDG